MAQRQQASPTHVSLVAAQNLTMSTTDEQKGSSNTLQAFCHSIRSRIREFDNITYPNIPNFPKASSLHLDPHVDGYSSNDPFDLAIITVDHIKRTDGGVRGLTPLQQDGQKELQAWLASHHIADATFEASTWTSHEMLALIQAFSKLFFLEDHQLLKGNAHVGFEWTRNLLTVGDALGDCCHIVENNADDCIRHVEIRVDPASQSSNQGPSEYLDQIFSTVLHEVIHAYLLTYCCDGTHDVADNCTRKGRVLWQNADSAHDIAWFHLACAIELRVHAITEAMGHPINRDLGTFRSYLSGVKASAGGTLLSAKEWKRFFETWNGACKLFDRLTPQEMASLGGWLDLDPMAMQVWAEAGERPRREDGEFVPAPSP